MQGISDKIRYKRKYKFLDKLCNEINPTLNTKLLGKAILYNLTSP
jgi:hypothetical protein